MPSPSSFPCPCSPVSQSPANVPDDSRQVPLSAESQAMLEAGIRSAKEHDPVYLGSFAQYADDDE